ncbi:hypothetical protein CCACVL1_14708, partial [Corchorus capsularis]
LTSPPVPPSSRLILPLPSPSAHRLHQPASLSIDQTNYHQHPLRLAFAPLPLRLPCPLQLRSTAA